jgi:hypothetical protein
LTAKNEKLKHDGELTKLPVFFVNRCTLHAVSIVHIGEIFVEIVPRVFPSYCAAGGLIIGTSLDMALTPEGRISSMAGIACANFRKSEAD